MMVLHCDHCHYDFERHGRVEQCPDCGKTGKVRAATTDEAKAYQARKREDLWADPLPSKVG